MGPTLDSLDSLESLDALDAEAPEGRGGGGPGSNVLGALCDALDSLDSDQGPNLMKLMNRKWHPGLSIQTPPPPNSGASESDEANGSNASQALALGPTFDALDALASGQALTLMNLLSLMSWPWARL